MRGREDDSSTQAEQAKGGKTTILYRFQVGTVVETLPTIGFNVETLTYKNLKLQVGLTRGYACICSKADCTLSLPLLDALPRLDSTYDAAIRPVLPGLGSRRPEQYTAIL